MSANGVVHVFSGDQKLPSEFIQLSDWMQQSTFFNVLCSIRFFKHYLAAKIFRLWRANVRYKLYDQCRSRLCKKLFLSKVSERATVRACYSPTLQPAWHPPRKVDAAAAVPHPHRCPLSPLAS